MLASILLKLDAITRALLPVHEQSNRQLAARARFGCAVIGTLVLIALVRVPMLLSRGPRPQAIALTACAILALIVPVIPRVLGSFVVAAHTLVLLSLLPLVSLVHFTGGSGSPALLALVLTPMIAVFLTGKRGGIGWSLVAGGVVCVYAIVDRLGLSPPVLFPPDAWKLEKSIGAFLLILAVLGLALSYERSRRIAEAEAVQAIRHADVRVAETESIHRDSMEWLSQSFAHEANNTLAYVMADLEHLREHETSRRDAGVAARLGAARLGHIVRDVQTITRSKDTEPSAECVAVDLGVVVDEVVDELAPLLRALGVDVRKISRAEGPVFVRSVPSALARCVASSLLAFTPETEIQIGVEGADRPAVVVTTRRGALEARPLATEALRRTLATFGGALVTTLEGEGATIRLEMTRAPAPARAVEAVTTATPGESKTKLRVLVVDDEPSILKTTQRLLRDYDVTTTSSARQALEHLASGGFDILLCDFNMPEMRGDRLLAAAVELGFDRARFVLMTGGDLVEVDEAFGKDRPLYVTKPYTRKSLEGIIRRAVSRLSAT